MGKPNLGLITGNGELPFVVCERAKLEGHQVFVAATKDETGIGIEKKCDAIEWIRLGQLGKVISFFNHHQVNQAIMIGKITKTNLFKGEIRPDFEMLKAFAKLKNHSDDSLLGGIADYLTQKGIHILDSTTFLDETYLPERGVLTKRKPSTQEQKDIQYGWHLAKEMGRLDVGQTVVVKKEAVLAVEAIEGTDDAIRRGGLLGNGKVVVVKVAKPNQDMRFDVPAFGMNTLKVMIEAGVSVFAFEAGKTIMLDRKEVIQTANDKGICIVATEGGWMK